MDKKSLIGITVFCILILFLTPFLYCQEANQILQLTIKSDKETYVTGQLLNIWGVLKNVGDQDIWVNTRANLTFYPRIVDKDGNSVDSELIAKIAQSPLGKEDFVYLQPGEETAVQVIKNGEYTARNAEQKFNLKSGIYTVWLEYENVPYERHHPWEPDLSGRDFGINAWTGKLISNRITIKVK